MMKESVKRRTINLNNFRTLDDYALTLSLFDYFFIKEKKVRDKFTSYIYKSSQNDCHPSTIIRIKIYIKLFLSFIEKHI